MIIYNVKLNKKLILKFILVIMAIICISLTCTLVYNLFTSSKRYIINWYIFDFSERFFYGT